MANNHECSQNEFGEVRLCGCGGVNLAIGPVTLHFSADEVRALHDLVVAAKQMVDTEKSSPSPEQRRVRKAKTLGTLH